MLTGEWLKPGPLGSLVLTVDGQETILGANVFQWERYQELVSKSGSPKAPDEKEDGTPKPSSEEEKKAAFVSKRLTILRMKNLEIAEIALNPIPGETPWPRDRIEKTFDIPQIRILATMWIDREIFNTQLSAQTDPKFFPGG